MICADILLHWWQYCHYNCFRKAFRQWKTFSSNTWERGTAFSTAITFWGCVRVCKFSRLQVGQFYTVVVLSVTKKVWQISIIIYLQQKTKDQQRNYCV